MSKKPILHLFIALSLMVAPIRVFIVHLRNAFPTGVTGEQQFVEAGQVPAGLQAAEWTRILERTGAQYLEIASLHASDTQAMTEAAEGLKADLDNIVRIRGETGARVQELESRQNRLEDENLATKSLLSNLQDVDMTEAIARC